MLLKKIVPANKKGQVVTNTVLGIGALIIGVIITFVIVSTLNNASLLTSASQEQNATDRLIGNFTEGIDNVSSKIPTILLIVAVVFLFGALVLLVAQSKRMGIGGGSSL
jgi:H+/Cl- antiporter ClcA|tara:strand:+ start:412 stop:738 length:327 start_codon:yes stop_codon:yes gene_type:complete